MLIDGCIFENLDKIIYIDEFDDFDNVENRLKELYEYRNGIKIKFEMEWCVDGIVMIIMMFFIDKRIVEFVVLEFVKKMNL